MVRVLAILSIVATLCFAALLALQVMELNHYKAAPSVWAPTP